MPRATVRAAIVDYLQAASTTTPGLQVVGQVFAHPPLFTSEATFFQNSWSGKSQGALIYVFLEEQFEQRIRLIGNQLGGKMRTYKVKLICFLRSTLVNAQDVDAANDTFLDALVLAIQENRQPGGAATVFQWGEGDEVGGIDIHVTAGWPRTIRAQIKQVYSVVEVLAIEMNT